MPIFALKSVACTFLETSEYYLRGQFPPILFHWIFSPSFALWSKQIFTFFFLSILYQSDSHEQMVPGAMKCSLIVFQAEKKDRNIGILTMSLGSFDFYLSIQFDFFWPFFAKKIKEEIRYIEFWHENNHNISVLTNFSSVSWPLTLFSLRQVEDFFIENALFSQ